jgi:catechol-2,3-dioxygenase
MSEIRLDHLNIPARDPVGLAKWYADTFSLKADKHVVRGPGLIIVFKQGDPIGRAVDDVHMGLRVPSIDALSGWAKKFAATPIVGPEFTSFRIADPEGNGVELYTPSA